MVKLIVAILLLAFPAASSSRQQGTNFEFQVEHLHTLRNCRGTLIVTADGIEYKAGHKEDSRSWRYADIRQIKVESSKSIEIVTYEDQKRMWGRDRIFRFRLVGGAMSSETSAMLMAKATRPVVTGLFPTTTELPTFELPVKHLHSFGGCDGTLKVYSDRVTFQSAEQPTDSRYWRYSDIGRFGQPSRYRFELTTFEDKFGGPQKVYNFQLKAEFPAEMYDFLWVRIHPTNYYLRSNREVREACRIGTRGLGLGFRDSGFSQIPDPEPRAPKRLGLLSDFAVYLF
jgi:hypothetical protein